MRVIAVDPGYDRLGVAVLEKGTKQENLLFSTCLETNKEDSVAERLHHAGKQFSEILSTHKPNILAIEKIFFNKNVKTAVAVAEVRGLIQYLALEANCKVHEYGPQEIKVAVTGYGKSDKNAVIEMVMRLLPESPKNALDDEYDAIAVGITCLAHHQSYTR